MGVNIGLFVGAGTDKRSVYMTKLIQAVIPTARVTTINLHRTVHGYWVPKKNTKATYQKGAGSDSRVQEALGRLCEGDKYDAFVSIDFALTQYLLPAKDAKSLSGIDKIAGMLHDLMGKPLLFHFDPTHTYVRSQKNEHHAAYTLMSNFMIKKLDAKMQGYVAPEKPVKFIIPTSVKELKACEEIAKRASLIAFDIETSGGYISVIGFACETRHPYTLVFVIPLYVNLDDAKGMYWADEPTFNFACDTVGRILANDVPKAAHNGAYDLTYIFRYGWFVQNYMYDTMLMLHSTWPSVPRALYVGCSLFLQRYRYWKDDAKDVGEDGKVKWRTPKRADDTYSYWHYNGLDCANTLELCLAILRLWTGDPTHRFPRQRNTTHMWRTYVRKFALEFGPAFYMSCVGMRSSPERQFALSSKLTQEASEARRDLQILVDDPGYNPNSPPQTATLLYDILDLKPLARKGRTTDKTVVQKFADMHPIFADVIGSIAAAKEPANNASKYGNMPLFDNEWFMYQIKACVTTTSRMASSKHNLGYGTNMQNVPKPMRVMCFAEKDEYLCSADYSQSDSYFVAFESQDEVMMETVTDDRDTHAVHVEFFFGSPYAKVVEGDKNKEDWVVHPVTGQRQIIKKVSHGTNYDMGGETMLLNVRRAAAISMVHALLSSKNAKLFMQYMGLDAAKHESYKGNGALWSDPQLAKACEFAQKLYYHRYPKLAKWKVAAVNQASMDYGVIQMFGGSSTVMLCAPSKNPRYVPAAYGQGGTGGNINNATLRLYYLNQDMWDDGFRLLIQIHDELVSAVPRDKTHMTQRKIDIMETPCTIHGRTFTIPVAADLAISWDAKNNVPWAKGEANADIRDAIQAAENKTLTKLGML